MESISNSIDPMCKKHAYSDWFCYASTTCSERGYKNGEGDASGFAQVACRESDDDDDDDVVYDYAPAA
nr:IRON MAN 6 [Lotus japonicus]